MTTRQLSESQQKELHQKFIDRRNDFIQSLDDSTDPQLMRAANQIRERDQCSLTENMVHLNLIEYASWVIQANILDRASADLRAGQYGRCDSCFEVIEFAILRADLGARRCRVCL